MDSQPSETPPLPPNDPFAQEDFAKPTARKGSVWLAWAAIVFAVGLAVGLHSFEDEEGPQDSPLGPYEIQAKTFVGLTSLAPETKTMYRNEISQAFGHGPVRRQLLGVVLLSELDGPKAALEALHRIEGEIKNESVAFTKEDEETVRLLLIMQQARDDNQFIDEDLTPEEFARSQKLFPQRMGWIGKLALLPAPGKAAEAEARSKLLSEAQVTAIIVFGVAIAAMFAAFLGLMIQIVWWVYVVLGRMSSGTGQLHGSHVIYAETFAVWMLLFMGLSRLLAFPIFGRIGIWGILIPQIGSLAALAWPVIRGIRWRDVREDIGLKLGPNPLTIPLVGVGTYLAALPAVGLGIMVTLLMMAIAKVIGFADENVAPAAHPIVEPILHGSWSLRLQLLVVAVFAAVPEEIMFRGVLYRHLRASESRFGYAGSVAFAAVASSLIFAAIHPQGIYGIPVLMSLAIVFALAREWRGSLFPVMIAHAMVNAGTSFVLFMLAD